MAEPVDAITYSVVDTVATITICRERRSNALARRHFDRLADLMGEAGEDVAVRAIVLTASGDRAFCAGADLSAEEGFVRNLADDRTTGLGNYLRRACIVPKPIIGRINGHCYAGGVGLLASCDFAVACDDARFALPEISLGIFPFVVLAALEDKVIRRHAMELALSGTPITAGRASEIGLVSQAVPRSELDVATQAIAVRLASLPAHAMAFSLRQARHDTIDRYREKISEAEAQSRTLAGSRGGH